MGMIRATIMMDEWLAAMVRQRFEGNLSRGVNVLLQEHLQEQKKNKRDLGTGMFKGENILADLMKMRREERRRGTW